MSQYQTLKAQVVANIYSNDNKEISGNILQAQLLAMINSLGAGFQYMGVATPATNPGTPDANVFYLASEAGTYTNFGGIVINEGEVCALVWNGTWTKQMTGAATADRLNQLDQELTELIDSNPPASSDASGDLSIMDEDANVILRLNGGEIKTKKFDSAKTPKQSDIPYDFASEDEDANVVLAIKDGGEIKSKKFDSTTTPYEIDNDITGFQIVDAQGNIVLQLKNGGIKTKYFNSAISINNQFRMLHWNVGHWCGGQNTQTSITTTEAKERAIKAYRTFFNKYNPDIVGISEYSDIFSSVDGVSSLAKDDLFAPFSRQLIGKTGSTGWVKNALFAKKGCPLGQVNYIDFESGFYALWTKSIVAGRSVVFCELHAPWQSAQSNIDAINAVINAFADEQYVIISGDFNTRTDSADAIFSALRLAGYDLANHGYMGEILTHGYADESHNIAGGIDNIAVKGGKILNIISPNSVDIETRQMVNTGSADGAYVDIMKYNIKIGYNIVGEDGFTYSLSDHLPIMCDIIF